MSVDNIDDIINDNRNKHNRNRPISDDDECEHRDCKKETQNISTVLYNICY